VPRVLLLLFLIMTSGNAIESNTEKGVRILQKKLPIKIDEFTMLVGVKQHNGELLYQHSLNLDNTFLKNVLDVEPSGMKSRSALSVMAKKIEKNATKNLCNREFTSSILKSGHNITMQYKVYRYGNKFSFVVKEEDCSGLRIRSANVDNMTKQIEKINSSLPIKINEMVTLKSIKLEGKNVVQTLYYNKIKAVEKFSNEERAVETFSGILKKQVCEKAGIKKLLKSDIVYSFELYWDDAIKIQTVRVDKKSCLK